MRQGKQRKHLQRLRWPAEPQQAAVHGNRAVRKHGVHQGMLPQQGRLPHVHAKPQGKRHAHARAQGWCTPQNTISTINKSGSHTQRPSGTRLMARPISRLTAMNAG